MSGRLSPRALALLSVGFLILASVVIGHQVVARLILPAPPLNFDEAAHSLPGYYILRDVLRLDLRAFWVDSHIQTLWPPGFSYLQAPFLLVFGRTDEGARLFAFAALVLAILAGCALVYQIKPDLAPLASLAAGLMALSAPGWLLLGSLALQETPVAWVSFVVFGCFLRAVHTGRAGWYALTGAALFFLFLTKYNYAAFALGAIALVDGVRRVRRRQPATTLVALYVPFLAGLALWFFGGTDVVSTDIKWRDFRFFVTNEDSGYSFWSAENLLFYVRAATDWLMPHPGLTLAAVLGAIWAVARIRHPGVAVLALFFGIGFVLATLHPLKSERYIAPLFPALWLLTGLGYADLATSLRRRVSSPSGRRLIAGVSAGLLIALTGLSWAAWLPRLEPTWAGGIADALRAASRRIVDWQDPARPVLIIGTFGELSPPLFEWRLRPQPAFADGNIQYNAPPGDGDLMQRVEQWLASYPDAQVTTIELSRDSALYHTHDVLTKNAIYQQLASDFVRQTNHRLVDSASYLDGGLMLRYYLPR